MKHLSFTTDVLMALIVFPLVVIVYMYAGHAIGKKPATQTNIKGDQVASKVTNNDTGYMKKNNILFDAGKSFSIKRSAARLPTQYKRLTEEEIRRIFTNWLNQLQRDTAVSSMMPSMYAAEEKKPF